MHERPAADRVPDKALVAEEVNGLAGCKPGHAVLLRQRLFRRDRAAHLQLAGGDPGAQDRGKLQVESGFALMVDLHMITLSRHLRAADWQGRIQPVFAGTSRM